MVRLGPVPRLNREQLVEFCQANSELRIEQTAGGELIITPPVFSDTGFRELELAADFVIWARSTAKGKVFGPSTGFTLPSGAMRSPDVSWVRPEQLDRLTAKQWASFAPILYWDCALVPTAFRRSRRKWPRTWPTARGWAG